MLSLGCYLTIISYSKSFGMNLTQRTAFKRDYLDLVLQSKSGIGLSASGGGECTEPADWIKTHSFIFSTWAVSRHPSRQTMP
jgi:hypothetical protein